MSFQPDFDFSSRVIFSEEKEDKELISQLNLFWKTNRKRTQKEKSTAKKTKLVDTKFDVGIRKNKLVSINNKNTLFEKLIEFREKLNQEFKQYKSSTTNDLLDDISSLFQRTLDQYESDVKRLHLISNDENELKNLFFKKQKREFHHLLVICMLHSKNQITEFFNAKGVDWRIVNNLEKMGLILVVRDFNRSIIEYKTDKTLRNRLISYVEHNGLDIYNFELIV